MSNYIVHSAKGSTWKNHKYYKKENGTYFYSQAEYETYKKTGKLPNEQEGDDENKSPYEKFVEAANKMTKKDSSKKSSKSSKSSKTSGSKSSKSSGSKSSKSAKGSDVKAKEPKSEKSSKTAKAEKESKQTKTTQKETETTKKISGSFSSYVKRMLSDSNITIGEKDSVYTVAKDDGSGYKVTIEKANGETEEVELNENLKVVRHDAFNDVDSFIAHHGILGQKWGKKNGPPYPLDFRKLSAEERELAKRKSISEGDVQTAAHKKNRNFYSDQELRDLMTRFDLNQRLSSLSTKDIKTGQEKVQDFANKMGSVADALNKGTNLYNAAAKISNSLFDTNLKIIGEKDNKDKGTKYTKEEYKNGKLSKTTTKTTKDGVTKEVVKQFVENKEGKKTSDISREEIDDFLERLDELEERLK